jgi:transposase
MNILNVSLQHSILTLATHGWSHRRIARELDLNRETVGRYLRLARSKPAISTPGSEADPAAKPAISTLGSMAGRQSLCQPWQPQIEAAVSVGLSAQRIYQDLVGDYGFSGSYQAVKRFVRQLRQTQPIPFVRMEVEPGAEAQVDFGQGAWVRVDGKRKRPHLFRIVLSHSRKGYSEAVWRQTTESFIRCLENAFRYYGGVPKTLVIDNLRAAVTREDWFDPELNAKVAEFCQHYGTVMLPTRPAMPQHKGKIKAGVKFAQNNALKGRSFESLSAQNLFLSDWESGVADTRIHGTTRQQVGKVFNAVERPQLLPLPESLFPAFEEAPRTVHRDGYIELQRSYYSVPPEYVGRQVWARWESRLVRVFNQRREVIAVHALAEPGKFATDPNHLHSQHRHVIQHGLDYLLDRARLIGAHTGSWAEAIAVPSASGSCTACCRWPANIPYPPWNAPPKLRCIMARGACATCVPCWTRPDRHRNWTFWKRIRSSAASTPTSTASPIALLPQPSTKNQPYHHEYHQPRNHPETTPSLRPGPDLERPAPRSRRQSFEPCRVFGTHPPR